ncbi:hypothetical protein [Mycobacterium asiaticum]|uniref:Uncharacterized protein n=1 Tax=Mycobacterium asiaticum TaxID=1790 RepID=A0A1A3MX42_MYCAS|nr:hypothetical protein [Mycobacterium asiaticum]OBK14096.1 hypothetical protein A5635_10400 [Mycobacterium asiaticum]
MASKNLTRGQWQIGELVMGPGTQYDVMPPKIGSYNVNNQDSQLPLTDTVLFGQDTFQGGTLTFTIGVKDNSPMRYIPNTLPTDLVTKASKLLGVLQAEWKADEVKQQFGGAKALIHCDGYGVTKQIWGRPRKFEYTPKTKTSQWRTVTAEFQRLDTVCHADTESLAGLTLDADPVFYSTGGDAACWFRVLLIGPQSHPIVNVGNNEIELNHDILAGVTVEVSSYPWMRRVIDSNGVNWRNKLIGQTKYLDQLQLPPSSPLPMSWTAEDTSPASRCLVLWRDAYQVI